MWRIVNDHFFFKTIVWIIWHDHSSWFVLNMRCIQQQVLEHFLLLNYAPAVVCALALRWKNFIWHMQKNHTGLNMYVYMLNEFYFSLRLLVIHRLIQIIIEYNSMYQRMLSQNLINVGVTVLLKIKIINHIYTLIELMLLLIRYRNL